MNVDELSERLDGAADYELLRYMQHYLCMTLDHTDNHTPNLNTALDLIYMEFARRGKETVYDMAYEVVSRKPDLCKTLLARRFGECA